MNYQKTTIVGNLGAKPELRYTTEGKPVCKFSVAVNQKSGEQKFTTWYKVVTWNGLAEDCAKYLEKGQNVLVEGRVQVEVWADKVSQEPRGSLVLTSNNVEFGEKSKGGVAGTEPEEMPF